MPVATLNNWRSIGRGPRSFRLGRAVKYLVADVAAWIERQQQADDRYQSFNLPSAARTESPSSGFGEAMGEHHWKGNRRYAKADVYALADLIREYQLSFAVACLYRTLCEQCDYRNLVYGGSITELHELTGLGRKTVTKYLDELCDKKLIADASTRRVQTDALRRVPRLLGADRPQ